MARITVDDCLQKLNNRFQLVLVGAKRAREISMMNKEPSVPPENDKPTVIAFREIAAGNVHLDILEQKEEQKEEF